MSGIASAHMDAVIKIEKGELLGLPAEYQPARFSIEQKSLRIASRTVTIPNCIWDRFGDVKQEDIEIHSSWYHDKTLLPPYIVISVKDDGNQNKYYDLMLNLDSLGVLSLEEWIRTSTSGRGRDVELTKECLSQWNVNTRSVAAEAKR